MKNKIKYFIILLWLIFLINISFAESSSCEVQSNENDCKINDTPEYLIKFMKNIKKIENNVKSASKTEWYDSSAYDSETGFIWPLNRLFSFRNYLTSFNFYTAETENDIPKQLKRDQDKLKKLWKEIKLIDWPKWNYEVSYKEICKWIDEKECWFDKNTKLYVNEVLKRLKESVQIIENQLENKASAIKTKQASNTIYWFDPEKLKDLKEDYSEENQKKCLIANKEKLWKILDFEKRYWCKKEETKKQEKDLQKSQAKQWKTEKEVKQAQKEDENVTKTLTDKGILWQAAENNISNAKDYYENFEKDKTFLDGILDEHKRFLTTLYAIFPEAKNGWENNSDHSESMKKIRTEAQKTVLSEQQTLFKINSSYKINKESWLEWKNSWDNMKWVITKMEKDLSLWLNEHNETKEISEQICNKQLTWHWNCYWN